MNFNIVKKKKDDDDDDLDEFDENEEVEEKGTKDTKDVKVSVKVDDDDDDDDKRDSYGDDYARRKMFRFMGFIVGAMLLLLLILYVISLFSKKSYTYSDVEVIMRDAAVSYFRDYPESLPQNENSIIQIDSSNLIAAEKMKSLDYYLTDGASCTGMVEVEKMSSEYVYTPYLNCGDIYTTIELYKKIMENNSVVTTGYGLYNTVSGHVFRGEVNNNYVELDNGVWRIVKITNNNNIVLIHNEGFSNTQPWDNRFNTETNFGSGINQYSASRISEYLKQQYDYTDDPSKKVKKAILSEKDKSKLISFSICAGKRGEKDEINNNSLECSDAISNQRIGLLTLSEYLYASVDTNCKSASTNSCRNYNYLVIRTNWWLATANKANTSTAYMVEQNGNVKVRTASDYAVVRPVVYLSGRALYLSGDGTKDNPYKIR